MDRALKSNKLGSDAGILVTKLSHLLHKLPFLYPFALENLTWISILFFSGVHYTLNRFIQYSLLLIIFQLGPKLILYI